MPLRYHPQCPQVFKPSHILPTLTVEEAGEIEGREAMEREARQAKAEAKEAARRVGTGLRRGVAWRCLCVRLLPLKKCSCQGMCCVELGGSVPFRWRLRAGTAPLVQTPPGT